MTNLVAELHTPLIVHAVHLQDGPQELSVVLMLSPPIAVESEDANRDKRDGNSNRGDPLPVLVMLVQTVGGRQHAPVHP